VLPLLERTGIAWPWKTIPRPLPMKILWLIDKIDHPLVGACVDTVNSMGVLENPETAVKKLAPYAFCNHFCDHKLDRDQFGIRFHGVALGDGDIDCFKTYQTIRELSPTDRITFEIEWDMGADALEVAREKEMDACIRSIQYARDVLKIGS
jgi:sugar phosphate isomerase/epimerase